MNNRLPEWFRQEIPDPSTRTTMQLLAKRKVHTVCRQAHCPNAGRCFKSGEMTFLILGDVCTRACLFCAVQKAPAQPSAPAVQEPQRIARLARELGLTYVVITSVTRDDLGDGGAGHFARTIRALRAIDKKVKVEALIPDFCGRNSALKTVVDSGPAVLAHNLETVRRLHSRLKPDASYARSLGVLRKIKSISPQQLTKSGLMLGLGEGQGDVIETMKDLRRVRCDILTLGQYLAPGRSYYPVRAFIGPQQFKAYQQRALELGFTKVLAGPLVRSSYQARQLYREALYA
ncbi:MAG TPA: lipoyl synthase [Patescibacteria group bacterium]|nr:lipoyl synthase [Patescibacteria group bacterium]